MPSNPHQDIVVPDEIRGRDPVLVMMPMPSDTNANGDIFGGWLLAQMDLAAGTAAYLFTRGIPVKTRAISEIEFHKPVYVGDKVSIYSSVVKVGNTSVTIKIESWVLRRKQMIYEKVTEGVFTMVAVGPDGRPTPVQGR
ncbi:MAG: acyl-CoA thioesterase [Micavibrio aeruginosavorus]|uniref:Acyl-CoA thioesterase n=1 Tax=Micavibrio aeruginosavorus TaxID=349221 RepID=A0A7T5UH63_9BACT|nr:MAG: acyl-CoA thioesterase [Micavibrio aeruginosavorus]